MRDVPNWSHGRSLVFLIEFYLIFLSSYSKTDDFILGKATSTGFTLLIRIILYLRFVTYVVNMTLLNTNDCH